ncbi:uncharacterized protein LOC105765301 [Gossypium raimondii]|uniref:uncharacterized protein LOC105765301 n=1 Tax=Gossypium raimondii TaxID=29730 RepID=UPI00227C122B|nr:uncharacterized protein LOC105765301 [Gossypium raimondii]
MSTRGTRGHDICRPGERRRRARPEFSSLGNMPNLDTNETLVSPATETGFQSRLARDDALSVTGFAPTVIEYLLEATESIMNDIDCTPEQKLKGAVSVLRDEAYQWWLSVEEGTQPGRQNWDYFKTAFQAKYVGASYVDARKREFMNLKQGDKSVAEYEDEFFRFSRYA